MMAQEDLQIEVRSAYGIPDSVWGLQKFDCVIVSDVRAESFGLSRMAALDTYVRSHSGCFIMTGGDDSFGSGGYYRTRIERMLPVRLDTEKSRNQPTVALVLVIDRSGSMSGQPIEMAKEAAKASAMLLSPTDQIGVIAHDSGAIPIIPLTRASNRLRIANAIATITSDGGTDILPGLTMAYDWLRASAARIKHVIVLSDGQSPNRERIWSVAEEMHGSKITVSVVGLGSGIDRMLLQNLARAGGGRLYLTQDANNIPKIFTKETSLAARSGVVDEAIGAQQVKTASFLRGVDIKSAPYLRGYNPTKPKVGADIYLVTNPYGEPLLARWRLGLGKVAAFTSDIKGRWAYAWLTGWLAGFKQLWAQLLRDTMRSRTYDEYRMYTAVESGRIHVTVDAVDKQDTFQNDLDSEVTVFDWWAPTRKRTVKLEQTAAGRYEASFTMHRYGAYVLQAEHRKRYQAPETKPGEKGKIYKETIAQSFGSVTLTYPREYLQLQPSPRECRKDASLCPGLQLLQRVSTVTGGAALGEASTSLGRIFDPGQGKELKYREMWHWLLYLMMGIFLLDIFLRRVRLFGFRPMRAA
jgi:Mg-chelatase subunit ChlD